MKVKYVRKGDREYAVLARSELDALIDRVIELRKRSADLARQLSQKAVGDDSVARMERVRRKQGVRLSQLASWSGVSLERIEAIEAGVTPPTEVESLRLARALGVPPETIAPNG